MANRLNSFPMGAVGFIDGLDLLTLPDKGFPVAHLTYRKRATSIRKPPTLESRLPVDRVLFEVGVHGAPYGRIEV